MYFHKSPAILKMVNKKLVWQIHTNEKEIFLTFDDGPTPLITRYVLSLLEQYNAKATFFLVGKQAEKHPTIVSEIIQAGHSIGNHTHTHANGWTTNHTDYKNDVEQCGGILRKLGLDTKIFRPPYGKINIKSIDFIHKYHKIVMWSYLSGDFDQKVNVHDSLKAMEQLNSGAILVFHDSIKAFDNLKKMLPPTLDYFSNKGFTFNKL